MEGNAEDSISRLPDEVLFHILCLLPFESAIQTIFLSSRWRILWNKSIVQQGTKEEVATAVSNFVTNFNEHNPTRNNRRLRFLFGKESVLLATIGPNNKLHLDFSNGKHQQLLLPRKFNLQLELNQNQSRTLALTVKSLDLVSVNYLSSEVVSSIVSSFRFLEKLKITSCNGLESLCINSNSNLQHLTIFDCLQLNSLHIKSPKLRTFRFRGQLPRINPEYHYNLEDAMLDCRAGPAAYSNFKSSEFDSVLLTIKNAEVLTLCKWTFEVLIYPSLSPLEADFQFYKLKDLWWIDNSNEGYNSDSLIYFLKLCPSLEHLFLTIDPKSHCVTTSIVRCSKQVDKYAHLGHLKVVKLEGFTNEDDEIKLADRLRELVTVEPLILASSDGICWRSLGNDSSKQKRIRNLEMMETLNVQEVKDKKELPTKHTHMSL